MCACLAAKTANDAMTPAYIHIFFSYSSFVLSIQPEAMKSVSIQDAFWIKAQWIKIQMDKKVIKNELHATTF